MRNRFRIGTAILIPLLAVIAWEVLRQHEPVYQGRPLGVWLRSYATNDYENPRMTRGPEGERQVHELDAVIRQFGTNALPALLTLLPSQEFPLEKQLDRHGSKPSPDSRGPAH